MDNEMERHLQIQEGTDKAEGTIRIYRTGLEQFTEWLQSEDLSYVEVDHRDIKRYLAYLKNDIGYAPRTIRGRFTAVSQFYEDVTENGTTSDDPTEPVRVGEYAPKTSKKEEITKQRHIWLTEKQIKQLVDNVPAPKIRNRLVVLFQYFTGLRRQEVVDVRLQDLNREERKVKVRGKGDKVHTAYWQPKLDGLLTAWIDGGYRDASPYARESDYLFVTESTPQMSASRVSYIVREAAKKAGLQEPLYEDAAGKTQNKITSHTLRHSFAMNYLKEPGNTIGELSQLLAHNSMETTQVYAEMQPDRLKDAYEASGLGKDLDL